MATITIDGIQYEAEAGKTIIEAARSNGIDIPHFCWHPALSVAGNCRMCLVEVEKMPKLAIACSTQVADGMVVHTKNERVVHARQAVMEFLLINHPLDCPICDEAGECKLQDYAYKHGTGTSRFDEEKEHKPKRVPLGPHVMLDVERCIMCSRCIRFCDEIAKEPSLTFSQRGDHVVLTTFPGQQLDNPYSMNTIDICPVGALTSREFRFKARVWEMSSTESLCPGCARGCNINIWTRNNEVMRQTPRFNPSVNGYWMCDNGRLKTPLQVNTPARIKMPRIRTFEGMRETGWDEALASVASELKVFRKNEVAVIDSAYASVEDNFVAQQFAHDVLGTRFIDFLRHVREEDQDQILVHADKTPNARGADACAFVAPDRATDASAIMQEIVHGNIKALVAIDDNIAADPAIATALDQLQYLVVLSSSENETTRKAHVVLPCSTYAEKNGTYVNCEGRVQRLRPAVATIEQDRALDGYAMSRLDKFGTPFDRWARGTKRDARPAWRILAALAATMGVRYKYQSAEDVFTAVATHVAPFRGMSYSRLGNKGLLLAEKKPATVSLP